MKGHNSEAVGRHRIDYLHKGKSGEPILFLHGFGVPPSEYELLLDKLAERHEVVAPVMYAMNVFNPQPTTIDDYTELTLEFAFKIFRGKSHFVGHSIGGTVALYSASQNSDIEKVVAMNPLLAVDYGVAGFAWRATYKTLKEILGVKGEQSSRKFGLTIPIPFIVNLAKNPTASYRIIKDISDFESGGLQVGTPALILFGEDDEYFDLHEQNLKQLQGTALDARIVRLAGMNHDWPIFSPEKAARSIEDFILQR